MLKNFPLLIAQYYFLFYRFKFDMKNLLLISDTSIKAKIKGIFEFFINNYNCSVEKRKEINTCLQLFSTLKSLSSSSPLESQISKAGKSFLLVCFFVDFPLSLVSLLLLHFVLDSK